MRQFLDDTDLLTSLRMLRSSDSRLFLLLEGDSDVRSLRRHINGDQCMVVSSHGKAHILKVMQRLEEEDEDLGGCASLVDRDFDHWMPGSNGTTPSNVFVTELYDRDADLLLGGGLLDDYLDVMLDPSKTLGNLRVSTAVEIRTILVTAAASVGRLRWASVRDGLRLRLSEFPLDKAIDHKGVVEATSMISIAIRRTRGCDCTATDVLAAYSRPTPTDDEQEFCSSHDLIRALTVTSRYWAMRVVRRGEIEVFAGGAAHCDLLREFKWFNDLDAWAQDQDCQLWNCPS